MSQHQDQPTPSVYRPLAGLRAVLTAVPPASALLRRWRWLMRVLSFRSSTSTKQGPRSCGEIVAKGGAAFGVAASVSDSGSVDSAFKVPDARSGRVDLLINNPGVSGNRASLEIDDDEWRRVMGINLDGVFYCSRAGGKRMGERGQGAIVNLSSIYSVVAAPERLTYCASKAVVAMLTKTLVIEWAAKGNFFNRREPKAADAHARATEQGVL
jgi:NAD(P)-dependent dehydrogenase (short-subunit alcohol dehydrogenase family)